ncbi:MAG TPA: polysaccharide deacetylase, partial [Pseudacidobacterium sp.]|nr:polysaccharide deacetylase [Pseudacidobacterium sp.]
MKQVFYDPQRKRWKRLRRVLDVTAVVLTVVLSVFAFSVIKRQSLPELLLPTQKRNYKALKQPDLKKAAAQHAARRKTHRHPSEIALNTDEGLRAAFYVNDSPSYSSLKAHIHQIDLLFPDWLHVVSPDGNLQGATSLYPVRFYNVVDAAGVHSVDPENSKVARAIADAKEDIEIFPMLNDYNSLANTWNGDVIGKMLEDPAAREKLHLQLDKFLYANP